jgi:hypothetical protein
MELKLNATREVYREFYGSKVKQMPELISEGRVPMNVSQFMQKRLDVRNSDAKVRDSFMNNYFDTGDAIVYHPDGRVKIVLDSQTLRDMTPETQIVGAALLIEEDVYNALDGEEFKKGKLGKVNKHMSREDVKVHPFWKVLARDQGLLNDYVNFTSAECNERFAFDNVMAIYPELSIETDERVNPGMKTVVVCGLESGDSANIGDTIKGYGRFIGIASETLSVQANGDSNIQRYTTADLQTVDKALKGLEGTLHPDILKQFTELRNKL